MNYKFSWDRGNAQKSLLKHGITNREAESIFEDDGKIIKEDLKHSETEIRYICIGRSEFGRILFSVYTHRKNRIRIIGTRIANKRERLFYES